MPQPFTPFGIASMTGLAALQEAGSPGPLQSARVCVGPPLSPRETASSGSVFGREFFAAVKPQLISSSVLYP